MFFGDFFQNKILNVICKIVFTAELIEIKYFLKDIWVLYLFSPIEIEA